MCDLRRVFNLICFMSWSCKIWTQ